MRSTEQILKDQSAGWNNDKLILETLLDIRDLLTNSIFISSDKGIDPGIFQNYKKPQ